MPQSVRKSIYYFLNSNAPRSRSRPVANARPIGKYRSKGVRLRFVGRPEIQRIVIWAFIVAIPLVLVGLPVLGWLEGAQAANGYTVRNVYLAGTIRLPVLAVEAVPATVSWT